MDVREKLIGLIAKAKYICANDYSDHTEDEYIADTLLDNGVTVQEWISVKDRLPRDGEYVIVVASGKCENITLVDAIEFAEFDMSEGWILEMWPEWENPKITYWMPSPEPPKAEKGG